MIHKVRLYIRVTLPGGKRPFLKPVFSANKKLEEGWATLNGQPKHFTDAVYYLRYLKDGKRVWERLTGDAQQALTAKVKLESRLRAIAEGVAVAPVADTAGTTSGRSLADAVKTYLEEISLTKKPTTHKMYAIGLRYFQESCRKGCLDHIDRNDMLRFAAHLRDEKDRSAISSATHFKNVCIFLKAQHVATGINKNDRPKNVE